MMECELSAVWPIGGSESLMYVLKSFIKRVIYTLFPLGLRKQLAVWINRQKWLSKHARAWWPHALLRDLAHDDPDAFHKFQWKHHLGYARSYDIASRFGFENFNETRKLLFTELPGRFRELGIDPDRDVNSVLDVGCSLGYHLRYMETNLFRAAERLAGLDIDVKAIEQGQRYLAELGSRVCLRSGDIVDLELLTGHDRFDVIFCCGTLLYLEERSAAELVVKMLEHADKVLVLSGLAWKDCDNRELPHSMLRHHDHTWYHNLDAMVEQAGGEILYRRCEHGTVVDGNTIYFLYARRAKTSPG